MKNRTEQVKIVLSADISTNPFSPDYHPDYPGRGPAGGLPPAATYGLPARAPPVQEEMAGLGEASVRRGFIRKVYGILLCQLTITGAIISCFMFVPEVKM